MVFVRNTSSGLFFNYLIYYVISEYLKNSLLAYFFPQCSFIYEIEKRDHLLLNMIADGSHFLF